MVTDHFVLNKTSRDVTNGSGPNLVLRHNIHLMSNRCIYRWYEYRRVQPTNTYLWLDNLEYSDLLVQNRKWKLFKIIINRLTCKGLSNQPQNYLGSVLCGQTGSNAISCLHRKKLNSRGWTDCTATHLSQRKIFYFIKITVYDKVPSEESVMITSKMHAQNF